MLEIAKALMPIFRRGNSEISLEMVQGEIKAYIDIRPKNYYNVWSAAF